MSAPPTDVEPIRAEVVSGFFFRRLYGFCPAQRRRCGKRIDNSAAFAYHLRLDRIEKYSVNIHAPEGCLTT